MPSFKLVAPPAVITITGFIPQDGLIRYRRGFKKYDAPTFELTVFLPHDGPKSFNVPYPLGAQALRKRVASYGPLLSHAQGRELEDLILKFARYVVNNHGVSRPYRPDPEDTEFGY